MLGHSQPPIRLWSTHKMFSQLINWLENRFSDLPRRGGLGGLLDLLEADWASCWTYQTRRIGRAVGLTCSGLGGLLVGGVLLSDGHTLYLFGQSFPLLYSGRPFVLSRYTWTNQTGDRGQATPSQARVDRWILGYGKGRGRDGRSFS